MSLPDYQSEVLYLRPRRQSTQSVSAQSTRGPCHVSRGFVLCPSGGADPMGDYAANLNLILKVLDFVQSGGPSGTVLQTFEWVVPL